MGLIPGAFKYIKQQTASDKLPLQGAVPFYPVVSKLFKYMLNQQTVSTPLICICLFNTSVHVNIIRTRYSTNENRTLKRYM